MRKPTHVGPSPEVWGAHGLLMQELHGDLVSRYKKHQVELESLWRSFDTKQRTACLTTPPLQAQDLNDSFKQFTIPEWNLGDMAESGPDFALTLLKDRATTSILEQYFGPMPSGAPGDHEVISRSVKTENIPQYAGEDYASFAEEGGAYGKRVKVLTPLDEGFEHFTTMVQHRVFLPASKAVILVLRQTDFWQLLIHLTDNIFLLGADTSNSNLVPSSTALAKQVIREVPSVEQSQFKLSVSDLVLRAGERNENAQDALGVLCNEPSVLTGIVYTHFPLRPDLLPDENGRTLPKGTDKYISGEILEIIQSRVREAANHEYIYRLLKLLEEKPDDKAYRAVILQELSNVCHHDYSCAKAKFKRYLQALTGAGLFRRESGVIDKAGSVVVKMKCNLVKLAKKDPYLHCMMHLCLSHTTSSDAIPWVKKIVAMYETNALAMDRLSDLEYDALNSFIDVIMFIHEINRTLTLPPVSRRKGQMFVQRSEELTTEILALRCQFDIRDFVTPIASMLKREVAKKALQALDQFIVDKIGGKMGFLYEDLVQECIGDLDSHYECEKARIEKQDEAQSTEWIPFPTATEETMKKRIEQRRQKEKTRPTHSSSYDINPTAPPAAEPVPEITPRPVFKVNSSTAKVFSTLFDTTQSRGSVHWVDFKGAMAELGFSVTPMWGSVYTFVPPEKMGARKLTLHRPHQAKIEGCHIFIFARRLTRTYGWGDNTFEPASFVSDKNDMVISTR